MPTNEWASSVEDAYALTRGRIAGDLVTHPTWDIHWWTFYLALCIAVTEHHLDSA